MKQEYEPGLRKSDEANAEVIPATLREELDRFFKRKMPVDVREERLAQRLLEAPQESPWWLVGFEDYLRQTKQFSTMLERDPRRAHRLISRHVRKVPFAVLTTFTFTEVLGDILPLLEQDKPLCPNPDTRPYSMHIVLDLPNERPFQGNAAAFVRCLRSILDSAWEKTLANITYPQHQYYPIWECFEAAHNALTFVTTSNPISAERQCLQTAEDNAVVALELLTHIRADYAEDSAEFHFEPSAGGVTRKAIKSADLIGWAASGNVESIGVKIGTDRLADHFPELETCTGQDLRARFPDRKRLAVASEVDVHSYRYNHPSLAEGPWPVGRFCPAVPWLESPCPESREMIERFDNYLTALRSCVIPDELKGTSREPDLTLFSRATLLLDIAALVGRETIFKEWNNKEEKISLRNGTISANF